MVALLLLSWLDDGDLLLLIDRMLVEGMTRSGSRRLRLMLKTV